MKKSYALEILNQVRETYNQIAESFSQTRSKVWPEFLFVKNLVEKGGKVLDFGCGNGRFFEVFQEKADYYGIDVSEKLICQAKKTYPKGRFYHFDALHIPFEDNFFDLVIAIAVFHHIPSKELREQLLLETKRVLKPQGRLVLSVWYLFHKPKILKKLLVFTCKRIFGKSRLDFFDIFVPWQNKYQRYIHLFNRKSLKKEVLNAGFKIEKSFILNRRKEKNIVLIAQK